jgi:hypothetical protein
MAELGGRPAVADGAGGGAGFVGQRRAAIEAPIQHQLLRQGPQDTCAVGAGGLAGHLLHGRLAVGDGAGRVAARRLILAHAEVQQTQLALQIAPRRLAAPGGFA